MATENEITVTTFTDVLNVGDGLTSLREAILATTDGIRDKTILLGEGTYTLSLDGTESDESRDLDIYANLTIVGKGTGLTSIDANQLDRIFEVSPNVTLTLSNLTITNGSSADKGGAIYNQGTINLTQTVFNNNYATNAGGAIYNDQAGIAAITDSVFSNNTAYGKDGPDGSVGISGGRAEFDVGVVYTDTIYGPLAHIWYTYYGERGGNGAKGGSGSDAAGGAIYNAINGSLTITSSQFTSNRVSGGDGGGGGKGGSGGTHSYTSWTPYLETLKTHDGDGGNGGKGGDGGNAYGSAIFNQGTLNFINQDSGLYADNTEDAGTGGSGGAGGSGGKVTGSLIPGGDRGFPGYSGADGTANSNDIHNLGTSASNTSTSSDDSLTGTAGADFFDSAAGNDKIQGLAGNDTLNGNAGNDNLIGGDGNDTLTGGTGNDRLEGGNGIDRIIEAANANFILTNASLSGNGADVLISIEQALLIGGIGNNTLNAAAFTLGQTILDGGLGNDRLTGGTSNDILLGGSGEDMLNGGIGNDTLAGEADNDKLGGQAGDDNLQGGAGDDILNGDFGNDSLQGDAGNDTLNGGVGNDILAGGAGVDQLVGNAGNDTYLIDITADSIVENTGEGIDTVESSITYTLSDNIENLTLTGTKAINATGNTLANTLTGNSTANTLNGGAGADTLQGAAGNDAYVVDNTGDKVIENIDDGVDKIQSYVTYALAANVENLILLGTLAINGTGNTLANILVGNVAANTLNGGIGADTLFGGTGDDTYIVDNIADKAIEYTSAGTDTVLSYATYALAANIENLTLLGTATNATGNTLANTLIGNNANNALNGGAGADKLQGGAGNDSYVVDNTGDKIVENAGAGTDTVLSSINYSLDTFGIIIENLTLTGTAVLNGTGNALNNSLTGNSAANILTDNLGNDLLNGGAGADTLQGGAGNDTYVVDNIGDKVAESASNGTDTVQSAISHSLAVNVENLSLVGTLAVNGTGNTLANVLTGNSAANSLNGGLGNDSLNGGAGDDTLNGEAGNDVLNGSTGIDTLIGGIGDDFYYIDTANDKVRENLAEGTDTVASPVTYTLGTNIERLTLTGTLALNGTGNALANVLTGNSGDNVLDGGAGADYLQGGSGNDTYKVDISTDKIVENTGAGVDTVQSSATYILSGNVENLTLTGTAAISGKGNDLDNTLIGNSANNTLNGGFGNDWLEGGAGKDTLQGGEDADTFVLSGTSWDWDAGTPVLSGGDTVTDCQLGIDHIKIRVSNGQMDPPVGDDDEWIDYDLWYEYHGEGDSRNDYYGDELVIITTNIAGNITASGAAAVMPEDGLGRGDKGNYASRIYVVDNGQDTAIYQFSSELDVWDDELGGYWDITAAELTLIGTLKGVAETTYADYGFL